MTVHPFGAKSSPSCSNFALQRTANEFGSEYFPEVQKTIFSNFYVGLKSMDIEDDLVKTAHEIVTVFKGCF